MTRAAAAAKPAAVAVEFRAIESLAPYAHNARTHSAAQIAQIKALMVEYGWTNPVLADQSGIIAGHGRVQAASELHAEGKVIRLPGGATLPPGTVPVLDCTGWSDTQRRAYIIADNKSALNAGWDSTLLQLELKELVVEGFAMNIVGFSEVELAALLDGTGALGPADHWQGMPEYEQADKTAFRQILVSFPTQADVDEFAARLEITLTDKTRFMWFPKQPLDRVADKDYAQA